MTVSSGQPLATPLSDNDIPSDPNIPAEALQKCLDELDALSKLTIGRSDDVSADILAGRLLSIAGCIARIGIDATVAFGHFVAASLASMPTTSDMLSGSGTESGSVIAEETSAPKDLGPLIIRIALDAEALDAILGSSHERVAAGGVTMSDASVRIQEIRHHLDSLRNRIAEAIGTWWPLGGMRPEVSAKTSPETIRVNALVLNALVQRLDFSRRTSNRYSTFL